MAQSTPAPSLHYLPRAGQVRHSLGGKTTFIAPLPLPTGCMAIDWAGTIHEVNDTYMDIGVSGKNKVFQVQVITFSLLFFYLLMLVVMPALAVYGALNGRYPHTAYSEFLGMLEASMWVVKYALFPLTVIFIFQIWYTTAIKGRHCALRFNRQRQELCYVPKKGKKAIFVPWERIAAWITSGVTSTGQTVVQQHEFGMGFYDPETKLTHYVYYGTVAPAVALGEWEAIRAFMEGGPEATLPAALGEGKALFDHNRWVLHEDVKGGESSWLYLIGWYLWHIFSLWRLPYWVAEWDKNYPLRPFPPEAQEWSKPLPKAQWAQPSDELVRESSLIRQAMSEGCGFMDYLQGKWQPSSEPVVAPVATDPQPFKLRPRKGPDGKFLKSRP